TAEGRVPDHMTTTKYPRPRAGVLFGMVCACALVIRCGSVPELLMERDDAFDGVCRALYGSACDRSCARDRDCSSGLYCGSDGTCTAECDREAETSCGREMCSDRGRCEPVLG